jgi:hypothetical protein
MSIPLRELPRAVWRRLRREAHARTAPRQPRPPAVDPAVRALAASFSTRQAPRFFGPLAEHAALAARHFPPARGAAIAQADAIRAHRFDLLGSGEMTLGAEIDWHTDFKSGHTWPLEHHTRLTLSAPDGGFDVKVPWELSRFHHALRLGQAYLYTGNDAYAHEITAQVAHWIAANPCEFGINWAGPMDVAIRAVNWVWAYRLIAGSPALTPEGAALWLASLREHANYLLTHLEDGWPRTNHLIANLTGLAYLGILLPELPQAVRWRAVGLRSLWRELERQVTPDGVDYEASTSYHRLVAEMSLHVAALCRINDIEIPQAADDRLRAMLDVIATCTRPNGTAPLIGDADDGRLLPLGAFDDPAHEANDHRHLLALAALVFDDAPAAWASAAGNAWQDALWCFGEKAAARMSAAQAAAIPSRGFAQGGLFVMCHGDLHLTARAGGVGQDGAGGHAHNDTLSVTLAAFGRTFLIDPGSYTYTSDPQARNAFRSTAYHNTLQIGGEEINRLRHDLFRLTEDAHVTIHRWHSSDDFDLLDASHDGYMRLTPGVTHRRQVWFDKAAGLWLLRDLLISPRGSAPEIDVTLWFHFAPLSAEVIPAAGAVCTADPAGPNLLILPLGDYPLQPALADGWYAPRYGIRSQAPVAKFTGRVRLPAALVTLLYPFRGAVDVEAAGEAGQAAFNALVRTVEAPGGQPSG